MSVRSRIVPILLGFFISFAPGKGEAAPQGISTEQRLVSVMADTKAREAASAAGKRAAFLCVHCHGEDGNSPLAHVPNLAGQNPVYLLHQIDKFGDGRRKDEFMSGLVKVLKPEDRFNMAVYYATQSVRPTPGHDVRLREAGGRHFARACAGCHGASARGTKDVARLAGQQPVYLRIALEGYRQGSGTRSDMRMTGVAKNLTNHEVAALAAYLSALP
ncbi:MAG: c-type cytochrome [Chloroflexi bacterium]|nr:c-type cytochrome [Chloroflexota bacterium]